LGPPTATREIQRFTPVPVPVLPSAAPRLPSICRHLCCTASALRRRSCRGRPERRLRGVVLVHAHPGGSNSQRLRTAGRHDNVTVVDCAFVHGASWSRPVTRSTLRPRRGRPRPRCPDDARAEPDEPDVRRPAADYVRAQSRSEPGRPCWCRRASRHARRAHRVRAREQRARRARAHRSVTDASPALGRAALVASFARHGVRFVLVGGLAAQAHGAARATKDADICPEWSAANLTRLAASLLEPRARLKISEGSVETLEIAIDPRTIHGLEIGAWRTAAGDVDVLLGIPGGAGLSWSATSSLPRTRRSSKSTVCASWSRRSATSSARTGSPIEPRTGGNSRNCARCDTPAARASASSKTFATLLRTRLVFRGTLLD